MVQIIRRSGLSHLHQLQSEMDRMFGGFFPVASGPSPAERGLVARVDLCETDEALLVRAEVPGILPEELDIQVDGDLLTIAGEKKDDREAQGEGWHLSERRFGAVRRQVRLPAEVDATSVSAEVKNGVLNLRLPKTQAAQPRKIPVQTGD